MDIDEDRSVILIGGQEAANGALWPSPLQPQKKISASALSTPLVDVGNSQTVTMCRPKSKFKVCNVPRVVRKLAKLIAAAAVKWSVHFLCLYYISYLRVSPWTKASNWYDILINWVFCDV